MAPPNAIITCSMDAAAELVSSSHYPVLSSHPLVSQARPYILVQAQPVTILRDISDAWSCPLPLGVWQLRV